MQQRVGRAVGPKQHVNTSKRPAYKIDDDLLETVRRVRRLHYKYLAARVITKWKQFAHERLATVRARRHYIARNLARAWINWRVYHLAAKRAQRNELVALIQFKYALQRKCWRAWWLCVMERPAKAALWAFAVRRVAKNIEYRAFTTWRVRYAERREIWDRACEHHKHALIRGCMELWKDHHMQWKQHWAALLHYHTQLELFTLRRWRAQMVLRTRIRAMRRAVLLRAARALLRSVLSVWRGYVHMKDNMSAIQDSAVENTRRSILERSFGIWSKKYEEAQRERWMWVQAVVFYESKIKEKVIIALRHYSIEKQSKRTATHMANYFHKRKLALQFLTIWKEMWKVKEKERRDKSKETALCHLKKVSVRKAWDNWVFYHQRKASTRGPLRRATAHYKKSVLGKLLLAWWRISTYHRGVLNLGSALVSRHCSYLLSHAFAHWYSSTLCKQTHNTQQELALHHYMRALKRRALRLLHDVAAQSAARQKQTYAAVRLRYLSLLRVTLRGWREYVSLRGEKHAVRRIAEKLHGKFVRQKCMEVWLDYVSHRRAVRLLYTKAAMHWQKQIFRKVLVEWRKCVERWIHKRYLLSRAARYLLNRIKRKYFQHWRLYAVTHAAHAQYKRAMYLRALVHMSKLLQKRIFSQWIEIHNHLKVRRIANQQARAHRRSFLLVQHFARWCNYAAEEKEHAALRMRAARFWLRKRLTNSIVAWHDWVAEHRRTRTESALAVRHWSIRVKWTAWIAWRAYTQKKQAGLMRKGMDMYKAYVTKAAATHWLKIGFSTRTARMQHGMQREARYAAALFNLVDKFARRWRSIVARRKRERLQGFINKTILTTSPITNDISTPTDNTSTNNTITANNNNSNNNIPTTYPQFPLKFKSLISTPSVQPLVPTPAHSYPNAHASSTPAIHPHTFTQTLPNTVRVPLSMPTQPIIQPTTQLLTAAISFTSQPLPLPPQPLAHPPAYPPNAPHAEISQIEQELLKFAQLKQQLEDCKKRHQRLLTELQAQDNSKSPAAIEENVPGQKGEHDEASQETETEGQREKEAKEDEARTEESKNAAMSEEISSLAQQMRSLSELKKLHLPHIKLLYAKIVQLKQSLV